MKIVRAFITVISKLVIIIWVLFTPVFSSYLYSFVISTNPQQPKLYVAFSCFVAVVVATIYFIQYFAPDEKDVSIN